MAPLKLLAGMSTFNSALSLTVPPVLAQAGITALIVTFTVIVSDLFDAFLTLTIKLSVPVTLLLGVYLTLLEDPVPPAAALPFVPCLLTDHLKVEPPASVAFSVILLKVF